MMIDAIIFDMDGLLVDSEPYWMAAEIEVFASVGIALTPKLCEQTMGLRIDAVVQYWYRRFPWTNKSVGQVADEISATIAASISRASALPGVQEIIEQGLSRNLLLALCSSSPYRVIEQVVAALGLTQLRVVYSAQDEAYGKPHPGAYMTTADKLGVAYERCLVFEDSLNGAIAGKAAGMRVVAVPQGDSSTSARFDFCDAKIASLLEFDSKYFDRFIGAGTA